jgi:hypothetical protein
MERFHIVDDAAVILRGRKGVYRQAKVYRRGEDVFAQVGFGYVRLLARNGTTDPSISWLDIEAEGVVATTNGPKFRPQLKVAAE